MIPVRRRSEKYLLRLNFEFFFLSRYAKNEYFWSAPNFFILVSKNRVHPRSNLENPTRHSPKSQILEIPEVK